jgi:hypothetical protein
MNLDVPLHCWKSELSRTLIDFHDRYLRCGSRSPTNRFLWLRYRAYPAYPAACSWFAMPSDSAAVDGANSNLRRPLVCFHQQEYRLSYWDGLYIRNPVSVFLGRFCSPNGNRRHFQSIYSRVYIAVFPDNSQIENSPSISNILGIVSEI